MCQCITTPVSGIPLQDHPQFKQLDDTLWRIRLASQALRSVGLLLQPQRLVADEHVDHVKRSEVSHVLEFFGEVLCAETNTALNAHDTLELFFYRQKITFQPTQGA